MQISLLILQKKVVQMQKITIKVTSNANIVKFELEDFIIKNKSFEYKNIDETKS